MVAKRRPKPAWPETRWKVSQCPNSVKANPNNLAMRQPSLWTAWWHGTPRSDWEYGDGMMPRDWECRWPNHERQIYYIRGYPPGNV